MDNPLYEAALEGRYVLDITVNKQGDEYVATWNRHGCKVEVRDVAESTASNLATQEALRQLRDVRSFDQMYG